MSQPARMLVGAVSGAGLGLIARGVAVDRAWLEWVLVHVAQPVGQVFLRLLFMLVVPLIFSAVVMGVGDLELKRLGRIALKTLAYTVVLSTLAVGIGLAAVNLVQPGVGLPDAVRAQARATSGALPTSIATAPATGVDLLVAMFPDNPLKAAAGGDMLGWLVFSLIFGVGLALTETRAAERLKETIQGLYDVSMRLIDAVLRLAPVGVAALLFSMTARLGVDILVQLAAYVGVVLLGLAVQMFVVYPLSVRIMGGRSPLAFFRQSRLAIVTAFATSSSSASLPTTLKVAEESLRLPRQVSRFVLTAGATMNQNGSALFEGVTVLFLAQLFGVHLGFAEQAVVMVICVLAGVGTAGIPSASLPVIAMILVRFGIPVEGLGLILGVDRFLDMCRTTVNVVGDLAAAVAIARGEPSPAAAATTAHASGA